MKSPTHFSAVYLLFVRDGQLLMIRRFNTGYEDGNYSVVAGHIEKGESPTQAAIREAREEAGVEITPNALEFAHVQHRWSGSPREYCDYYFWVRHWQGEPRNCEPDKCDDMRWVSPNDLPPNTTPFVRQAIRAAFDHATPYGEYGYSN
ncbi:MAG: NUDIX domain-containing protein [Anaerolineae bacterium]|nr:NUDIX domain-containing protein [Anaerolineae bacterium]